jgi:hypothetical protein
MRAEMRIRMGSAASMAKGEAHVEEISKIRNEDRVRRTQEKGKEKKERMKNGREMTECTVHSVH